MICFLKSHCFQVHNKPVVSYIFDTLLELFKVFKFGIGLSGYILLQSHAYDVMQYFLNDNPEDSPNLNSPIYAL